MSKKTGRERQKNEIERKKRKERGRGMKRRKQGGREGGRREGRKKGRDGRGPNTCKTGQSIGPWSNLEFTVYIKNI